MFKKICIIGCGLIGSSLARAIKKYDLCENLVSCNRSESTNKKVLELKIVDQASSDIKKMVHDSDLVIVATPLSSYKEVMLNIKDSLKGDMILSDVGSVKKNVINLVEKLIPKDISWIPTHPIAGTEESGPDAGFADLFKNRWCIFTPSKQAKKEDISKLKKFWQKIGSKIDTMNPDDHDYILSITSHLPHLIAYNIVNTATNISSENKSPIVKYSAGGLRDFTRIAASNPIMWRDIFMQNKTQVSKMIEKFIGNLEELKDAIEHADGEKLEKIFTMTRRIRQEIVDSGQDINKPNFGRNS